MINAKEELLAHVKDVGKQVEFVSISFVEKYDKPPIKIKGTLKEVLPLFNFKYDNGYGGQFLFGYIWYTDGTWSSRSEYDGSEWWQYNECPDRNVKIETY